MVKKIILIVASPTGWGGKIVNYFLIFLPWKNGDLSFFKMLY
jgi:hypothetical protein